jgi:hypothetical protein
MFLTYALINNALINDNSLPHYLKTGVGKLIFHMAVSNYTYHFTI